MANIVTDIRKVKYLLTLKEVAICWLNMNDERCVIKCVHHLQPYLCCQGERFKQKKLGLQEEVCSAKFCDLEYYFLPVPKNSLILCEQR